MPSESIVRSIGGTVVRGFGANHSLCHGDLGNLELLRMAMTERELSAGLGPVVDALQRSILAQIDEFGPQCGIPLAVETPGLMTGLAGVGYGLLRISAPEVVPSVLTMEPPRSRR